jgi:hypothetical protein
LIQDREPTRNLDSKDPHAWIRSFQIQISHFFCGDFFDSIDSEPTSAIQMSRGARSLLDHLVSAVEDGEREREPPRPWQSSLMISWIRVDCCTGKSAGFSPLRIRPV